MRQMADFVFEDELNPSPRDVVVLGIGARRKLVSEKLIDGMTSWWKLCKTNE